tara:strand:- start:416 stop:736 length:321 start_codon:yes stop_codon:yes gene_type:complete
MYQPLPKNLKLGKSDIHGYGLFADKGIKKGTTLGISHVAHDLFDNGWIRTPLGGFYNHSNTPNCHLENKHLNKNDTHVKILVALKDIKVDEELTCFYTIWKMHLKE